MFLTFVCSYKTQVKLKKKKKLWSSWKTELTKATQRRWIIMNVDTDNLRWIEFTLTGENFPSLSILCLLSVDYNLSNH